MILLLLSACLERVTGEPVPLDPLYYAAHEEVHGEEGIGGGSATPFSNFDGKMVTLRGSVDSKFVDLPVDIDVRVPNPEAPGGVDGKGKLLLDLPGAFELKVPSGQGKLELQAFQDRDQDGPSGDDPFASVWVDVGESDLEGIVLEMVEGARGGGPVHTPAPPGAPGGGPGGGPGGEMGGSPGGGDPGGGGPGGNPDLFADYEGRRIVMKGSLVCDCEGDIDLDLFKPDASAPGGRTMLGKLKKPAGDYEIEVPENFGALILEGFVDVTGDGPSPGDAMGRYENNPVKIGSADISGIDIVLAVPEDGIMPGDEPRPPPKPEELNPGAPPPSGEGI